MFFSLFGIMHGANYHQPDGMMIPAMGADESDYYTTDLGELTVSLPIMATYESWQSPFLASIGVGFITPYEYTYKTDDLGETWTPLGAAFEHPRNRARCNKTPVSTRWILPASQGHQHDGLSGGDLIVQELYLVEAVNLNPL